MSLRSPDRRYATFVPNAVSIFAQASLAVCPGEKAGNAALTYLWTMSFADAVSSSVDPRYFKLPAYSLNSTQVVD